MTMTEANLDLIRKVTWSFINTHVGLEFDDLFSEACVACLEAEEKYDPARGDRSTFIWQVVSNRLTKVIKKDAIYKHAEGLPLIDEHHTDDPDPEQITIAKEQWAELMGSLSAEAQTICELTINGDEYMETDKPRKCRGQLRWVLRDLGWGWPSIWNRMGEIRKALNQNRAAGYNKGKGVA